MIIIILTVIFNSTALAFEQPEFIKHQSYELAQLLQLFIPDQGSKKPFLTWDIKERPNNVFWLGNGVSKKTDTLYPYQLDGSVGVLFNGVSAQRTIQSWENGELIKSVKEIGFSSDVSVMGQLYWNARVVRISIPISPIKIQKLVTGAPGALLFGNYLASQGIVAEMLWNYGSSGYGETGWLVQSDGKEPVWIICRTTHGANGLIGSTTILIFYTLEEAEKDSAITHYYPKSQ